MANHGYVTTRKHLSVEKVDAAIREIVTKHFGDEITKIEAGPGEGGDIKHSWWIEFCDDEYRGFSVWLMSQRKLEFRHPLGMGVERWAQHIMVEELALKFEGMISDEGVPGERWAPEVDKIGTFYKWTNRGVGTAMGRLLREVSKDILPRLKKMPSYE